MAKAAGSTVEWGNWLGMNLARVYHSTTTQEMEMERFSGGVEGLRTSPDLQDSKEEDEETTCSLVTFQARPSHKLSLQ